MSKEKQDIEQLRREAKKLLKEDDLNLRIRSCWNCNLAHEYLKEADYVINCYQCGDWYYKGVNITEN
jgi:hypothetical protein